MTSQLTPFMPFESKGIISDELIWLYEIQYTYMKFLDKLLGTLVIMNHIKTKYLVRSILRNMIDISKILRFKNSLYISRSSASINIAAHQSGTFYYI